MRWLVAHVEKGDLVEVLARRGHLLAPHDRAFWSLIAEVPFRATPGGGRPTWAG
jgi:hypothetical protein